MRTDDPDFIRSVEIILHFDNKGAAECPFCRKFIKWAQEFDGTINEAWEQSTELYQSLGLLQTLTISERLGRTYDPENPKPYMGLLNRDMAVVMFEHIIRLIREDLASSPIKTYVLIERLENFDRELEKHKKFDRIHRVSHIYGSEKNFLNDVCDLLLPEVQGECIDILRRYVPRLYIEIGNP